MRNYEYWNTPTGQTAGSGGQFEVSYMAKSSTLSGGARMLNNSAAGYIGGPKNSGTVKFTGIQSRSRQRKTIKIHYLNGDSSTRYASLVINGAKSQKVAFLSTGGGKSISVTSAHLQAGLNTLEIAGFNNTWGPDIASLEIAA
jgi:hypothetical protein